MDWAALRVSLIGTESRSLIPARVKLPILPLAVTKFSKRADDPNATAGELGKIIETDTGLTCELLRYVNSSARGMSQKAKSAQQAVSLVGVTECRLYLLTKAVERALRGLESKLINLRSFWTTSLERALFARHIARLLKTDAEVAFAGAMLQDFLLPSLTNDLFPTYLAFSEKRDDNPNDLHEFEQEAQRWDHAEAAAQLMFGWGFPDELICCVLLHHRGLKLLNNRQLGRSRRSLGTHAGRIPAGWQRHGTTHRPRFQVARVRFVGSSKAG
jgi:HD-like signal output (HDOD) protein